ncbi:multinuclear nonheme iron-dependent oxidase [Cohnella kolymensis]|uniref:multinuclear nonheme iron-dependent oxidase n=1 Tax=Cohnella kolymensis TaxID=1590652 RepID=UPI0013791607|nr:DUF692 family multinuclear iron-containing protein [Cohnella kolymensis]
MDWIKLSLRDTVWTEHAISSPFCPQLLHTLPHASKRDFEDIDFDEINKQIKACKSPHIALHLLAKKEDWDADEVTDEEIIDRMLHVVLRWKKELEADLLIENVPYYGFRGTFRCATDPEVITRICNEADIGLMLDLAHLRVAACHRGEEVDQYLEAMPLNRVREIHVCGPGMDPERGYFRDRHLEMQETDYNLLEKSLALTTPVVVTLEYGGTGPIFEWRSEIDVLERQLNRLNNIVANN